jgi:uncharacterized protein YbjT (DUF2867 family)
MTELGTIIVSGATGRVGGAALSALLGTPAEAAASHLAIEQLVRAEVPESIAVRPNAFMQVLLGYAQQLPSGVVRAPLGDAAVSWVDSVDVGQVAAALLLADDAPEPVVEVTGPEALTMALVCDAMARVTGRAVTYEAVSDHAARARMIADGASPWFADHVLSVFGLFRVRDAGHVTDAVSRYTGHPATTVAQFFDAHADVLDADARA